VLKASGKPKETAFATADGRIIARFNGDSTAFTVGANPYLIVQTSHLVPAYDLVRQGEVVASAKRAMFLSRYAIDWAGKVWMLKARGLTERKYALLEGKVEIGAIFPVSFFSPYREIVVDLPKEIVGEVQVFMTSIVMNSWSDG
jgi:hypothetical protein